MNSQTSQAETIGQLVRDYSTKIVSSQCTRKCNRNNKCVRTGPDIEDKLIKLYINALEKN